ERVVAREVADAPLVELARRDVAPDAAVADELARGVEHRLTADARPRLEVEAMVDVAELEVAEGEVRFQERAVREPVVRRHVGVLLLPARAPEQVLRVERAGGIRHGGEAKLRVLLPEDIRGERAQ